ncbi:SLAM family member 8-like [Anolis sagrei]|uniref:SLAM family member 8-like n=1 Tax=Anolis sagrei TaxID=38937 RepID=UPI0035200A7C
MPPWSSPRTALFSITFICSFLGVVNDAVLMPICKVNGMLNGTVLLPIRNISTSKIIYRIGWDFQPQNGIRFFIAEFQDGTLKRLNPNDRFGSRLELADETSLRIRNLEKKDSGLYTAQVTFILGETQEHLYHLKVYDPVQVPQILHQTVSNSSTRCNVTLECWLSEKARLNVSWRIGNDLRTLEGSSGWYQLSSDGWRLHVSMGSNATDSNFTCLVSNPADQKHISIDLLSICSLEGDEPIWKQWGLMVRLIVLSFLVGFCTIWNCRKKRKCFTRQADPPRPRVTTPEHLSYGNQNERNSPEINIYELLQENRTDGLQTEAQLCGPDDSLELMTQGPPASNKELVGSETRKSCGI